MRHLALVTSELAPWVPGGAGSLNAELRSRCVAAGIRVSVVLAPAEGVEGVLGHDIVLARGDDPAGWDLSFMTRSKAAAETLASVHAADPVDHIEFQDFDGLAFWALTHRRDLGIEDIPISVRFHGPVDLQVEAMGATTPELDAVAAMEREVFAMADRVITPSDGIRRLVIDRYEVSPDRVVVGWPPVRSLLDDLVWEPGGSELLVIGRLSEVKGSHDLVEAVIPVLTDHPEVSVAFAGSDGWSASTHTPMSAMLADRMPSELADRFVFAGTLSRDQLAHRIASCRAVVVPSRFESFNLAVHEARRMGAPVIVPNLPAFDGLLDETTGALVFDGTIHGLARALSIAASDEAEMHRLASSPPPVTGDGLEPYTHDAVEPWHVRSQGGLATAAIARVEQVWLEPKRQPPPESIGRRLLQRVPPGLFTAAKRAVPNVVKDRLRESTDWGEEADRRKWEDRFDQAVARVAVLDAAGDPPDVSVIMPCYNQGGFVREALLSVFEQTVGGFEVVIIDDGSDDGTTTPFLAGLDLPRVRVVHQENRGLPGARNVGIAHSSAEFVVMLDADDLLQRRYLEALRGAVDTDPQVAYAHCWAELFGDTHRVWATRPYNPYQLLLSNSVVGCVLMRREACLAVGGYDESMRSGNEDWDLWIRLMAAGYEQVQVREPLFRYRKHGVSMSVATESRYEAALEDRVARHPALYARASLAARKAAAYPLLSIIVEDASEIGDGHADVEVIELGDRDVASAVGDVNGKYTTYLAGESTVAIADLIAMSVILEDDPEAGAALTRSVDPVSVVRTWSLFDPAGPAAVVETGFDGSALERLTPGDHPNVAWMVPNEIDGVPVLRQRPEEAGVLPDWIPA